MKSIMCMLLLTAFSLTAGEVTGKWSGNIDVQTPDGQPRSEQTFMELKQEGEIVTGTAGPNEAKQMPIRNGKIDGNKVSFEMQAEDGAPSLKFELTLQDDDILEGDVQTEASGHKLLAKLSMKRVQ